MLLLVCFLNWLILVQCCRKQQATSWALDGLASSPELAQWGDQLHSKLRLWQRAFTMAMVALTIAVSVLGYQTAVYHSGGCSGSQDDLLQLCMLLVSFMIAACYLDVHVSAFGI